MEMQRVVEGTLNFNEETREYKFIVEGYRFVTFNFYLQEYSDKGESPITARVYIQFKDRYEILYGNNIYTKHEADLELRKLFTFTNHDVTLSCKVVLTLNPEYSSAMVEYDILKEPR